MFVATVGLILDDGASVISSVILLLFVLSTLRRSSLVFTVFLVLELTLVLFSDTAETVFLGLVAVPPPAMFSTVLFGFFDLFILSINKSF